MTTQLAFAAVNGIVLGMAVFLVAAGLTLVFGILRIFNFAHGSFFMIGAYLAHAIMGQEPSALWFYLGASLTAAGLPPISTVTTMLRGTWPAAQDGAQRFGLAMQALG